MCRASREIWAISSRNTVIAACLMGYCRRFADVVVNYALSGKADELARPRLMALLAPYFEGYSATTRVLAIYAPAVAEMAMQVSLHDA